MLDNAGLNEALYGDQWIFASGVVTPTIEQTLILYGYLVSDLVEDTEIEIDTNVSPRKISYTLYMNKKNYLKHKLRMKAIAFVERKGSDSLVGKAMKLAYLNLGIVDPQKIIKKMVDDYTFTFRKEDKYLVEVNVQFR